MTSENLFNFDMAFSRNIGWLTPEEQQVLRQKTIAIAGLGGVGGVHFLTLVRLGFENFHIADFDQFEIQNFNRQIGARISTLGKNKIEVLIKDALDINPNLKITPFAEGINEENLPQFLKGVDIYLDGLDFFVLSLREKVFAYCHKNNIPAITAAPIGFGSAIMTFMPNKMSFEDYFGFEGKSDFQKAARFLAGLSPSMIHLKSLVIRSKGSIKKKAAPSTISGCQIASGVAACEVVKLALGRGEITIAPRNLHFDSYSQRMKIYRTWFGKFNPLFLLKVKVIEYLNN